MIPKGAQRLRVSASISGSTLVLLLQLIIIIYVTLPKNLPELIASHSAYLYSKGQS